MTEENDQIGIDDTVKKAAVIGKEDEEIPDYDIVEGDEDEDDDRPLAKERTPRQENDSKKKLTNREKRQLHKQRTKEKFNAKDEVIARQSQELEQFHAWKAEVDNRLTGVDKQKVSELLTAAENNFNVAKQNQIRAINEGDGQAAADAVAQMYEAQKHIEKLQTAKVQLDTRPAAQPRQNNGPKPEVIAKAKAWAERHKEWYSVTGDNEDSVIAEAISGKLVKEGLDPGTDRYWNELDKRLHKRGILDEDEVVGDDEDDEDDEEEQPAVKKRSAPPVGGGSVRKPESKKTVKLPTAYINALKESGKWEDPATRNRMIKRYFDTKKANEQR